MKNIFLLSIFAFLVSCSPEDSNSGSLIDQNSNVLGEESFTLKILGGPIVQRTYTFSDVYLIESDNNFYDYALSSSEDWRNEAPLGFRTELNALEFPVGEEVRVIENSSNFIIKNNETDSLYGSGGLTVKILRKFRPVGEEFGPNDYAYDLDLESNLADGFGGVSFPIEFNIRNLVIRNCTTKCN